MQNTRVGKSEALQNTPKVKKTRRSFKWKRPVKIGLFTLSIFLVALILLGTHFVILPGFKVLGYLENIKDNASLLVKDLSVKSIANIDEYLGNIQDELSKIDDEISKYEFLKSIDQTKGYYDNFQTGRRILEKGNTLIEFSLPRLKNILTATGFSTDRESASILSSLEQESEDEDEEGTISLVLRELPLYLNLYSEIEPQIIEIFAEVEKINPDFIPSLPSIDIKGNLESVNALGREFPTLSQKTVDLIKYLPDLLGSQDQTTYLVVMQNESEMRSSGGILTAFGDITLKHGEISEDIKLDDTLNLQAYMWQIGLPMPHNNIYGQSYLMNYGCGATEARAQDSNHYPDLYESLMLFKDYYNRANFYNPRDFPSYDHMVIINFAFAQNLLSLIQPLYVEGFGEVTADTLFNFIKAETDDTSKYQAYDKGRKDILGDISTAVKEKLFNMPYSEMPRLIDLVVSSFQARDVGLASKNDQIQSFFDEYGMSGRYAKEVKGDYFSLSEAQNCALKMNLWVRNIVQHTVNINEDGSISREVFVKWTQPKIYDHSLYGQYSADTSHSYRAWLRYILPVGTSSIVSNGYSKSGYLYYRPIQYFDKVFNKQVSDNIVQFDHRRFTEADPIEKSDMTVTYRLPDTINYIADGEYTLLLQKHPGKSWGEVHTININDPAGNHYTIEVTLDRDKVVRFKDGIISIDNYDTKLDWLMDDIINKLPFDRL